MLADTTPNRRPTLRDELASLDRQARRELATTLCRVSETFAEVPDGRTASHVLGVLAYMLHSAFESGLGELARAVEFRGNQGEIGCALHIESGVVGFHVMD